MRLVFHIACFIFLFQCCISFSVSGQVVYATSQTNGTYGCHLLFGCGSEAGVADANKAVTNPFTDFAIMTANVKLVSPSGNAFLQLKFDDSFAAGTPVYIKIGTPTTTGIVSGLLGILGLVGKNIYVDAYAGSSVVSASSLNNVTMRKNGSNELFLLLTPTAKFNAVRIRVEAPADLASSVKLPVYYALSGFEPAACSQQPSYTDLGTISGVNVNLDVAVSNPQNAIDNSDVTASSLTTGAVSLLATVKQTVFFPTLSQAGEGIMMRLSIPSSLLDADLFNNVNVQTFNGGNPASAVQNLGNAILNVDLLALFANNSIVTVYFKSPASFDRVVISCSSFLQLNVWKSGGADIHDIKRVPGKPVFTAPLKDTVFTCYGQTASLSVDPPASGNLSAKWYASSASNDITVLNSGSSFTTPSLTGTTTYWVSMAFAGCTAESERVPVTASVIPLPSAVLDPVPDACNSAAHFQILYSNLQNNPATYKIEWNAAALSVHFLPVAYTGLSASPLDIAMPIPVVPSGSYQGTFYLKNGNNCEQGYPFTLKVREPPDIHTSTIYQ